MSPLIIVVGVGLPKFELVFDDIANQCVSLAYIISFSAGVDRKGIGLGTMVVRIMVSVLSEGPQGF